MAKRTMGTASIMDDSDFRSLIPDEGASVISIDPNSSDEGVMEINVDSNSGVDSGEMIETPISGI